MADQVDITLKNEIVISYNNEQYAFKIPTMWNLLEVGKKSAEIRRELDPTNTANLGSDPSMLMFTEQLARFITLLNSTDAKWVYSVVDRKPVVDYRNWSADVPILEVMNQFDTELDKFREARASVGQPITPEVVESKPNT